MKLFSSKVMSGIFVCLTFFSFSCSVKEKAEVKDYVSYVDPYIGSGAHGHVFVGANVPFGAVQLSPETDIIFCQVLINIKSEVQA